MNGKIALTGILALTGALAATSAGAGDPPGAISSCISYSGGSASSMATVASPRIFDCFPIIVSTPNTLQPETVLRDEIQALGINQSDVLPGLMVWERSVHEGTLTAMPLPRLGFQLRVELPLSTALTPPKAPTPPTEVASPATEPKPSPAPVIVPAPLPLGVEVVAAEGGSSGIQEAVARLQLKLQQYAMLNPSAGPSPVPGGQPVTPLDWNLARGNIIYSVDLVDQWSEVQAAVGVSVDYDFPLVKAGLKADFEMDRTKETNTALIRMVQPLFTVSLVDDKLYSADKFIGLTGTEFTSWFFSNWQAGTFDRNNAPAYVKAVTYGRMLLVSATNTASMSRTDLAAMMNVAAKGELASKDRGCLHAQYCRLKASTKTTFRYFAIGGTEADALEAINSGDYYSFFGAKTAVSDDNSGKKGTCANWKAEVRKFCKPDGEASSLQQALADIKAETNHKPALPVINPASYLTAVPLSFRANYLALPRSPVSVSVPKGKADQDGLVCPGEDVYRQCLLDYALPELKPKAYQAAVKHCRKEWLWEKVDTGSGLKCVYRTESNTSNDVIQSYYAETAVPSEHPKDDITQLTTGPEKKKRYPDAIVWADKLTKSCTARWSTAHCNHGETLAKYEFPKSFVSLFNGPMGNERTRDLKASFCFTTYSASEHIKEPYHEGCWTDGRGNSIMVNCPQLSELRSHTPPGKMVHNNLMEGSTVCVPAFAAGCTITKVDDWTDVDAHSWWLSRHLRKLLWPKTAKDLEISKYGCVRGIYDIYLKAEVPPQQSEIWEGLDLPESSTPPKGN